VTDFDAAAFAVEGQEKDWSAVKSFGVQENRANSSKPLPALKTFFHLWRRKVAKVFWGEGQSENRFFGGAMTLLINANSCFLAEFQIHRKIELSILQIFFSLLKSLML
jgi:hypothetical protein